MANPSRKVTPPGAFLLELGIYSAFVLAYLLLVLHFLGGAIEHIPHKQDALCDTGAGAHRGAGIMLEIVTSALKGMFLRRPR